MMDKNHMPDYASQSARGSPPDEEQIVALLERIQPHPTERFYRHMASAPWKKRGPITRHEKDSPLRRSPRLLLVVASIFLAIIGIVFAFPSLGALAEQWMRFFVPNPGETISLKVTVPSPGDPNVFGAPGYFSLSISETEHLAGYKAREISLDDIVDLIPGLEFTGAHYNSEMRAIILRYSVENHHLYLTQYPLGSTQEYNTIGPSAPVQKVLVRGAEGEYVVGGWKAARPENVATQPGTQLNLDVVWDPNLPQRILRWQEAGFLFEILTSASLGREIDLEKEDLIRIAEAVR